MTINFEKKFAKNERMAKYPETFNGNRRWRRWKVFLNYVFRCSLKENSNSLLVRTRFLSTYRQFAWISNNIFAETISNVQSTWAYLDEVSTVRCPKTPQCNVDCSCSFNHEPRNRFLTNPHCKEIVGKNIEM